MPYQVRRRGMGAAAPSAYPVLVNPSTDPGVFFGQAATYNYQMNLQSVQQAANRINAQISGAGGSNFVGIDQNAFNAWWNSFPGGPGVGDPPPETFWTGLSAAQNDPISAQYTFYVGKVPTQLSLPSQVVQNSLTTGVPADLVGVAIGGPNCNPANPASCFGGGTVPATTSTILPSVKNATQQASTVISSGAVPSTLPAATSSNAPNSGTQGSGTATSNGPGAVLQSLGLSNQTLMLLGLGIVAAIALPHVLGGHK